MMSHICSTLASTLKWSVLILTALSLFSCKDDKKTENPSPAADQTKPVVTITFPTNDGKLPAGATFTILGAVTDNQDLSQVKITMHNAFDGHTHRTAEADTFRLDTVINVSGVAANLNKAIKLPADAASGPYHIMIQALDKAGNRSEMVELDVEVTNAKQPKIVSISSALGGSDTTYQLNLNGESYIQDTMKVEFDSPSDVKKIEIIFFEVTKNSNGEETEKETHRRTSELKPPFPLGSMFIGYNVEKSKFKQNTDYEVKVIVENAEKYKSFQHFSTLRVIH
jgi:copper(I)-binding protein